MQQSAQLSQNPSHFTTALCDATFSHKSNIISTTPGNVSKQALLPLKGCAMSQAVSIWRLDRRPGHVGCMMDNKALGQLVLQIHFSPVSYHSINVPYPFVTDTTQSQQLTMLVNSNMTLNKTLTNTFLLDTSVFH